MPGTSQSGGRNQKSAAQHRLEGTFQASRHAGGMAMADPPKGRPTRPKGLRGAARAEWTRMVARLEAARILSTVDDGVLYQYCCLFAETEGILASRRTNIALVAKLKNAMRKLRGEDLVDAITQIVQLKKLESKTTTQLRQGHLALRSYLVEFGMTPAARSRVKVADAPAIVDPFAEFAVEGATH